MSNEKNLSIKAKFINGVIIKKLSKIPDERGAVYHMLKKEDELFESFGEIYFSTVYHGAIKGWHLHKKMVLNYSVVSGMIKLVLFDDRENSDTKGNLMEIFIGDENYLLVKIPPGIWNGFKGISTNKAIVANCSSISHDPDEIERMNIINSKINYDWNIKNE